jgi:hypothetical protein
MRKIIAWSRNNKINFNEDKSKVTTISRRKRKENKEINIYLNNNPLQQVSTMTYLGIAIDNKFIFSEHMNYAAIEVANLYTAYPNRLN